MSPTLRNRLFGLVFVLFVTAGCSGDRDSFNISRLGGCADTNTCVSNPPLEINSVRPANVSIPADYNTATRYPLVIVLHGFGASGFIQSLYFGLTDRVDTQQYVLIAPDGTLNSNDTRFWNATPACCAFSETDQQVDDVGYVRDLITEAALTYSIDEDRIGLIGHSNGGFMSLRMACEASELISSVVSLAGSTFVDAATCAPADNPVSVLAVHGDDDGTISYDGRDGEFGFPSAPVTTERFAALAGCDVNNPITPPAINLMDTIDGDETTVIDYRGCQQNAEVSLWTIVDGPHIPLVFNAAALDSFVEWLVNHPRS